MLTLPQITVDFDDSVPGDYVLLYVDVAVIPDANGDPDVAGYQVRREVYAEQYGGLVTEEEVGDRHWEDLGAALNVLMDAVRREWDRVRREEVAEWRPDPKHDPSSIAYDVDDFLPYEDRRPVNWGGGGGDERY